MTIVGARVIQLKSKWKMLVHIQKKESEWALIFHAYILKIYKIINGTDSISHLRPFDCCSFINAVSV